MKGPFSTLVCTRKQKNGPSREGGRERGREGGREKEREEIKEDQ